MGNPGSGGVTKYVLSKYLFAAKIIAQSGAVGGYHYHRQAKGFSVAPDTLIIPLSDEECENMNRATLTHYQNNKVADVTAERKGHSDDHVVIPLTESLAIQGNELIENKVEIPENNRNDYR